VRSDAGNRTLAEKGSPAMTKEKLTTLQAFFLVTTSVIARRR